MGRGTGTLIGMPTFLRFVTADSAATRDGSETILINMDLIEEFLVVPADPHTTLELRNAVMGSKNVFFGPSGMSEADVNSRLQILQEELKRGGSSNVIFTPVVDGAGYELPVEVGTTGS